MVKEHVKYMRYVKDQIMNKSSLNFLILFVTSKCNSKCKTCFVYDRLNKKDDLHLEEYYKISDNMGNFPNLLLSGGEPFITPNLVDVCSKFIKDNGVKILSIPTNGSFVNKILKDSETLAKKFPNTIISINPSLDGMEKVHDEIRGLPGGFKKTIETINGLSELKEKYPNLQVIVNTCIHKDNFEEAKNLAEYLRQFEIDHHAFELIRGNPPSKELKKATLEKTKEIHQFILKNRKYYIDRKNNNFANKIIERVMVLGSLNYIHKFKESSMEKGKWPKTCVAGKSIMVIYPNGETALCELKSVVGNIRDFNYRIDKLLASPRAQEELEKVKTCHCTHVCFINATMASKPSTVFQIPYNYWKSGKL